MKSGASLTERFDGWFVKPIEKLRELPEGDGGFLALSAALFLCERYYRTLTNTHEEQGDDESFKHRAAEDMGLDVHDFKCFWKVYRHGIQHQGMPRRHVENGISYKWSMSGDFNAIPQIHRVNGQTREIRLDPWKFAELIIGKFRANANILEGATLHAFGEVSDR